MPVRTARRIVREGIISLTVSVIIHLTQGSILDRGIELFITLPVLLALMPPLGGMAGAIGSMFCARLSTALHLGTVRPRIEYNEVLTKNVLGVMTIAVVSSTYLSLAMYLLSDFAGIRTLNLFELAEITMVASLSVLCTTLTAALLISFFSFRRNMDPSSTTIPLVTATGDLATALSLVLAARILGIT